MELTPLELQLIRVALEVHAAQIREILAKLNQAVVVPAPASKSEV